MRTLAQAATVLRVVARHFDNADGLDTTVLAADDLVTAVADYLLGPGDRSDLCDKYEKFRRAEQAGETP